MFLLILPGYSESNKEWAEEVAQHLKLKTKDTILVHNWRHWATGTFSLPREVKSVLEEVGSEKFNIIAKSVGTQVAAKLLTQIPIQIEKIILCGIPTTGEAAWEKYGAVLKDVNPKKIIVFQNKKDHFASYSEIKKLMHKVNPKIKVIEKPRSDHSYPYFEDFVLFLSG